MAASMASGRASSYWSQASPPPALRATNAGAPIRLMALA